ncbi:MAG: hypothetical protein GY773_04080, partial [Actinomycetia bacterium]|nr:hypothetical protein [Actinomycetes bacterium]
PDATGLRLYLYADGPDTETTTITEYAQIRVLPQRSVAFQMVPEPGSAPDLVTRPISASEYVAEVSGASGPFVLVLADSYASGWEIDGLPDGWTATHIEADGYANGWRIDGSGDAELTIRYGPQRLVQYASMGSGATLMLVAMTIPLTAGRSRTWDRRESWRGGIRWWSTAYRWIMRLVEMMGNRLEPVPETAAAGEGDS